MASENSTAADLAKYVQYQIGLVPELLPDIKLLEKFFETLFYASLNTEEGEFIKVTAVYFDPLEMHAKDRRPDQWRYVPFKEKLPFDIKTLIKLSKAADPWASSIATFHEGGKLWIYGLIDQAIHAQTYLYYENDSRPQQPGKFQCSIIGIGSLSVVHSYTLIATLRQNIIHKKQVDVFNYGLVSSRLAEFVKPVKSEIAQYMAKPEVRSNSEIDVQFVDIRWRSVISRILNGINVYHHGGAILITDSEENLNIKYPLNYNRLATSFINVLKNEVLQNFYYGDFDTETHQDNEYIENFVSAVDNGHFYRNELKGAIRFVASQSRVDGLVLFSSALLLKGFGAVIEGLTSPAEIYVASAAGPTESSLSKRDPASHGTRHRSMFAYCWHYPKSLGFVISQDGDIRAIMRHEDKLIVWENIKTNQYTKAKPGRN